ncbi:MAG TPA: high frequency lysogenization protein HflD [Methylococcaceae bacterium]|jgi:high frequency lysogenization protein|nr:high frequency lysogenization protein HflD [Methylococcaceae bacterium]
MIKNLTNQAIALAGLTQSVHLVQSIAKSGSANDEDMETSIGSVFKINADDVPDVYGDVDKLKTGLGLLVKQLGGPDGIDPELARYAASLIFLERKLQGQPKMLETIRTGIEKATAQAAHFGILHENVLANLADIYQQTISRLMPRVMVQGEPAHLTNPDNANKIRALLLSGIRSAVLWRQCGGNRWKFLIYRRKLLEETRRLLKSP